MLNNYLVIISSTVLVNNIVLTKILGLCPFMGVSKKLETSISMSAATAFVLTIGSMTSWAINHYLLEPNDLVYLRKSVILVFLFLLYSFFRNFNNYFWCTDIFCIHAPVRFYYFTYRYYNFSF